MSETDLNIDDVARLARLELTDDEKVTYAKQLEQVLGHMDKLNAVNIDGVEPMAHAFSLTNVLEADEAREPLSPEAALQNAPEQRDQQFVVPKVVEDA
ncbi:Asp-tRNA(Asn)/Glu-tRNA(Gln) amidotransferase subunit GatC [Rubellicoccus peritrichatus]|uniref:Aspartyl/glutamyl-tRNA(Asn/Gln) amidotransferase subunit C n=1 Tax=Rubellicoccus peritrichatus TaxID=3080537 RepID=A0AAQ3LB62_9BACT|nr:Asp-tRNA(Asn)/Glu-tRNA(Gln) amidotransferase subunit GatC [Puniceicoccus sp. CR14]WOO42072.1 Asp-tRNA(Asn)/Glu-tRNA(Gln) amidotransferase subunit GatC [Puniceicoccus sp. CR14]